MLKRLIIQSIKRAHPKSECISNSFYSIYAYDEPQQLQEIWSTKNPYQGKIPLITFNCRRDSNPLEFIVKSSIHSHLFIEYKALFAVLIGMTHWSNYEVGSVFQIRRIPDKFDSSMEPYLNFLTVI